MEKKLMTNSRELRWSKSFIELIIEDMKYNFILVCQYDKK